eukprot:12335857-Alexandrium_andersonii.AAC.1
MPRDSLKPGSRPASCTGSTGPRGRRARGRPAARSCPWPRRGQARAGELQGGVLGHAGAGH